MASSSGSPDSRGVGSEHDRPPSPLWSSTPKLESHTEVQPTPRRSGSILAALSILRRTAASTRTTITAIVIIVGATPFGIDVTLGVENQPTNPGHLLGEKAPIVSRDDLLEDGQQSPEKQPLPLLTAG